MLFNIYATLSDVLCFTMATQPRYRSCLIRTIPTTLAGCQITIMGPGNEFIVQNDYSGKLIRFFALGFLKWAICRVCFFWTDCLANFYFDLHVFHLGSAIPHTESYCEIICLGLHRQFNGFRIQVSTFYICMTCVYVCAHVHRPQFFGFIFIVPSSYRLKCPRTTIKCQFENNRGEPSPLADGETSQLFLQSTQPSFWSIWWQIKLVAR